MRWAEGSGGLDGSASSPYGGYAAPQAAAAPASGYAAAASDYSPPAPEDNFASAASAPASYEEEIDDGYGAPEQDTLAGYGGGEERRTGRKQGNRGGRRGRVGQQPGVGQTNKASSRPFWKQRTEQQKAVRRRGEQEDTWTGCWWREAGQGQGELRRAKRRKQPVSGKGGIKKSKQKGK